MNTYLSRSEKELFTRLDCLLGAADDIKRMYEEKGKNNDKDFMKALKLGLTWLNKAMLRRVELMDADAREDLKRNVKHVQVLLVPNDRMHAEFDRLSRLNGTLHISMEDFEDWYEAVIPGTCGNCHCEDYEGCKLREFLMRYEIYPVNLKAKGTCQYNYLDAGIDLKKLSEDVSKNKLTRQQLAELLEEKMELLA